MSASLGSASTGTKTDAPTTGLVLVAKVAGQVDLEHQGRRTRVLAEQSVPSGATLFTSAEASVVLVFSNAATVQLGADSVLGVREYRQAPFAGVVKLGEATEEPSVSTTVLHLERGELVGQTLRLRLEQGSSFRVRTAAGDFDVQEPASNAFTIALRRATTGSLEVQAKVTREMAFSPKSGPPVLVTPAKPLRQTIVP